MYIRTQRALAVGVSDCVSMEDRKEDIPSPSDISVLDITKGTFAEEGETIVSLVDIDSSEHRRKIDTKMD